MLLGLATLYRSRVLLRASLMVLLKEEKMDFRLRMPTQLEAKRREFWRGAGKDTFFHLVIAVSFPQAITRRELTFPTQRL